MSSTKSDAPMSVPSKFPMVKITGGPHGRVVEMEIDGEKVARVHRVELVARVDDVVRVTTYQYAQVDVEVEASTKERYAASVYLRTSDGDQTAWKKSAVGEGDTLREAIEDALIQYEAAQPKEL